MSRYGGAALTPLGADRCYALVALLAALLAAAQGGKGAALLACLLLALVPWALVALDRPLPLPAFVLLAVLPVVPVVLSAGIDGALFLTTAAASRTASRSDDRRTVGGTVLLVTALPFLADAVGHGDEGALYFAFGDLFGVFAGVLLRRETRLTAQLRQADAELRQADARLAEASAREERQRLARDVHDLVAHSLTIVVLHVGGARRVLRTDPAAAEGALGDAERVCRESLDAIRGVVGLLRRDDADGVAAGSLDVADVVRSYRAAGLEVQLSADPLPDALAPLQRVALHHVVQEALANAARHAGPAARVQVRLRVDPDAVRLRVANEHRPGSAPGGGYGLAGLTERVGALGGELVWGPEGSSWVVGCVLPRADVPVQAG